MSQRERQGQTRVPLLLEPVAGVMIVVQMLLLPLLMLLLVLLLVVLLVVLVVVAASPIGTRCGPSGLQHAACSSDDDAADEHSGESQTVNLL